MTVIKEALVGAETLIRGHDTLVADAPEGGRSTAEFPARLIGGRYELLGLLGAGGMGSVYRVRDTELDEIVALKMLQRELVSSPDMNERFRREVKLARRVTHPNVARMFDIGEDHGEKFLTMELVDGEPLAHLVQRGPLTIARVVEIVAAVCQGLTAAHAAGVVHRDLKPDNVLLSRDGRVVITDFGIARGAVGPGAAQQTIGGVVGTPAYMAPEQVEGGAVDGRADLYALGVMVFEMLTGTLPWEGEHPYAVALARLLRPPPDPRQRRPELPEPLAQVVLRCLARRPDERYATAAEVAAALARLTVPVAAPQATQVLLPGPAPEPPLHGGQAPGKSVAILPLRNQGTPEDDYLAAGLTEELIDTLSMARGLRVRPRGAVAHLKGQDLDPREVGRKLDVQVVVEGSLRRLGDRVRVLTRLVSVSDGFQLWARRFDRPAAEVLVISDEAARAITEALTVQAAPPAREAAADGRAIDLYLRARHEYRKGDQPAMVQALALFQQAVALMPDDPTLLAGYALTCARCWFFGTEGAADLASDAADRALRLAPHRGEPHLATAIVRFQQGDHVGAATALRQALVLSPSLAEAYDLIGRILVESGPIDEGVKWLRTAIALDPTLSSRATLDLARAHALLGQWEECDRLLDEPQFVHAGLWITRARLYAWRGDRERGLAYLDRVAGSGEAAGPALGVLRIAIGATSGEAAESTLVATFNTPHSSRRSRAFFGQLVAEMACRMGDLGRAISAVEQAAADGLQDLMWLERCPLLAPLHADWRFAGLRERLGRRAAEIQRAWRG